MSQSSLPTPQGLLKDLTETKNSMDIVRGTSHQKVTIRIGRWPLICLCVIYSLNVGRKWCQCLTSSEWQTGSPFPCCMMIPIFRRPIYWHDSQLPQTQQAHISAIRLSNAVAQPAFSPTQSLSWCIRNQHQQSESYYHKLLHFQTHTPSTYSPLVQFSSSCNLYLHLSFPLPPSSSLSPSLVPSLDTGSETGEEK